MLYREIIAVCSEIHTKHINTLCGQNVELLNVKPGGTCSKNWTLKGLSTLNMETRDSSKMLMFIHPYKMFSLWILITSVCRRNKKNNCIEYIDSSESSNSSDNQDSPAVYAT
jgi:hypothetical protein